MNLNLINIRYYLPLAFNLILLVPILDMINQYINKVNYRDLEPNSIGLVISLFIVPFFLFVFAYHTIFKLYPKMNSIQTLFAMVMIFITNPFVVWFFYIYTITIYFNLPYDINVLIVSNIVVSIVVNLVYYKNFKS
jgi:hypothetical protein